MDLLNSLITFFIGSLVGYACARLVDHLRTIEEEVHDLVIHEKPHKDDSGVSRLRPIILDMVLLGVVVMVVYAAWSAGQAQSALRDDVQRDQIKLCQAGQESREADRRMVDAIYNLVIAVVERRKSDPPLTDEEVLRTNQYIDRANFFREDLYNQIGPSEFCAPYVADDDVEPPTPPREHVTN